MASAGTRCQLASQSFLDDRKKFVEAPSVEHVFQPRLVAVGTIAIFDEDAHDGVGNADGFIRLENDPGIAGEILVAGDAAERQAEIDARFNAKSFTHLDGLKGDVVGFFQRGDAPSSVKRDIELARQAVERALVEDVIMPRLAHRAACRAVPADRCPPSRCR